MKPIIWTIAGSDNSGGAGIARDVKTISQLGAHACPIISVVTAQSPLSVTWESVSEKLLRRQIESLWETYFPTCIKIGLLSTVQNIQILCEYLDLFKSKKIKIIFDPILMTSSGYELYELGYTSCIQKELMPFVDIVTPNIPEAEKLVGHSCQTFDEMKRTSKKFIDWGAGSVVMKGGHLSHDKCIDYFTDGSREAWLKSDRIEGKFRGTGCIFSSAMATALTAEPDPEDAVVKAKIEVNKYIQKESGQFVQVLPNYFKSSKNLLRKYLFPTCGDEPLGFYPIVPNSEWVERLMMCGVKTIQLRIKDKQAYDLKKEIRKSIALTKNTDCRLFINDFWEIACQEGAYGVHLGQEDLDQSDLLKIQSSRLRLGVSTHSYSELARAVTLKPSYIAMGPIYPTTCKSMRFGPQGLEKLKHFRTLVADDIPLVAIGGISLERAQRVLETGVQGIAVISDFMNAPEVETRVKEWLIIHNKINRDLKDNLVGPVSVQANGL
jgi:hydroxymethylpyrimidine kinase / phosphomethylpyrimidine kinase / thiamine-phosphate diphosphorylase